MLQVEQAAMEAARLGLAAVAKPPRGCAELADQFRRAVTSVALNTTEAVGRHGGDRTHLVSVARGSAKEASVALVLLASLGAVDTEAQQAIEVLLDRARAMLWRLAGPK